MTYLIAFQQDVWPAFLRICTSVICIEKASAFTPLSIYLTSSVKVPGQATEFGPSLI